MSNYKEYGNKPFQVVTLHGGPGGIGDIAPLSRFIMKYCSVIEPYMREKTIDMQLETLASMITDKSVVIGHSWGAMMAILFAHNNPDMVQKLILIGCSPLDKFDSSIIMQTRIDRLNDYEREELISNMDLLYKEESDKVAVLTKIKTLIDHADLKNPIEFDYADIELRPDVNAALWPQTIDLRDGGVFIEALKNIKSQIVFIHGEYDPHPVSQIEMVIPLLHDGKLVVLEECGHSPWLERDAMENFYNIIVEEI